MRPLDRPAATWAIVAAYVVVGGCLLFGHVIVHDEGLSTYFFARYVGDDFLPALFCQKFKPVVALAYAPVARLGLRAFLVAHVLVGAAGVLLAARVARALGAGMSNLVAAIVASSPLYLVGGPLGLSNVDGVVAVCLVLLLYARDPDSPIWALVLGALPWIRYELALLVATLVAWDVATRRRWMALAGAAAFPAAYLLAGALYHRDLLWAIHFPPSAPPQSSNPLWSGVRAQGTIGHLVVRLGLVTPLAALAPFAPWRSLRGVERAAAVFAALYLLALNVLPRLRVVNFDYSPRYSLEALPVLALLAARAAARRRATSPLSPRVASALAGVAALASPALMWSRLREYGYGPSPALEQTTDWLRAHADVVRGRRVYTDVSSLASYLRLRGRGGLDVRYLEGDDQAYELSVLTDPANGQRDAVARLVARTFYAPPERLGAARADDLAPGTLFVLSADARLPSRLSADVRRHLRIVAICQGIRIASLEPEPEDLGEAPCRGADDDAPPPEVVALVDGLHAGDVLGSWTVERVHAPHEHQLRIDVRDADRGVTLFVAPLDRAPRDVPRSTARYGVFYGSPRPAWATVTTDEVADALDALADRIRRGETRAPPPPVL